MAGSATVRCGQPAHAYVGPGAGFAFVSSFFILFVTFLLAFLTLLTWPIRWIFQTIRGRAALAGAASGASSSWASTVRTPNLPANSWMRAAPELQKAEGAGVIP
jgi:hypothetical protein